MTINILILSSRSTGGAYLAAKRLADRLNTSENLNAELFTLDPDARKISSWLFWVWKMCLFVDRYLRALLFHSKYLPYSVNFLIGYFPITRMLPKLSGFDKLICVWTGDGLNLEALLSKINKKYELEIVLMLCDYGFITGGCHFLNGCNNADNRCKQCPAAKNILGKTIVARRYDKLNQIIADCSSYIAFNENLYRFALQHHERVKRFQFINPQNLFTPGSTTVGNKKLLILAYDIADLRKGLSLSVQWLQKNNTFLEVNCVDIFCFAPVRDYLQENGINASALPIVSNDFNLSLIYKDMDFVLSTPIEDAGPMMAYEALLSGCFLISSDVGAAHELDIEKNYIGRYITSSFEDLDLTQIDKHFISMKTNSIFQRYQKVEDLIGE